MEVCQPCRVASPCQCVERKYTNTQYTNIQQNKHTLHKYENIYKYTKESFSGGSVPALQSGLSLPVCGAEIGGKVAERRYHPGLTGNSANIHTQLQKNTNTQIYKYTHTNRRKSGRVQIPPWINRK